MSTRVIYAARVLTAVVTLTVLSAALAAQTVPSGSLTGTVELGMREYWHDLAQREAGKFWEYRDLDRGPIVHLLDLTYEPGDKFRSLHVVGRDLGSNDRALWVRATQPGLFDFQLRWNRIPHTFSTVARMAGEESSRGVFTLPDPRPDTATWNALPYLGPVRTYWNPLRLAATYTPSPQWDLKASFTSIGKQGDRPLGMAFGSPGTNHREVLEPIDQRVQAIRLTESYIGSRGQVVLSYEHSRFDNDLSSVIADNPLRTTDSPTAGASSGRIALAPSNVAHTAMVSGALNLPLRTRLTSVVSLGWRRQDEPFIAPTINSALTDPRISQIPSSLDGDVRTGLYTLAAVSRPWRPLTLSARWRRYELDDRTAVVHVGFRVVNDRSIDSSGTDAHRYPFTRENADVSATWRQGPLALTGALGRDRWDRDFDVRNVDVTTEHTARLALDVDVFDWGMLRAAYSTGRRRSDSYRQVTDEELPELRRFDQANRDRERMDFMASISPIDQITIGATYGLGHDGYPDSDYGLQRERSIVLGGDVTWVPSSRFTLGAQWMDEDFKNQQRSRYREPNMLDNLTFDWVARNLDRITTYGVNASAVVIPNRLDVGATVERSRAYLDMLAANPTPPTGGTTNQNTSALAEDFPRITQRLTPMSAFARVRVNSQWAVTARFLYEDYRDSDFRTQDLLPATVGDILLGNDYLPYRARLFTVGLTFRPRVVPAPRSAL